MFQKFLQAKRGRKLLREKKKGCNVNPLVGAQMTATLTSDSSDLYTELLNDRWRELTEWENQKQCFLWEH